MRKVNNVLTVALVLFLFGTSLAYSASGHVPQECQGAELEHHWLHIETYPQQWVSSHVEVIEYADPNFFEAYYSYCHPPIVLRFEPATGIPSWSRGAKMMVNSTPPVQHEDIGLIPSDTLLATFRDNNGSSQEIALFSVLSVNPETKTAVLFVPNL